jgi:cell wall-associated NlpC family hydrolase
MRGERGTRGGIVRGAIALSVVLCASLLPAGLSSAAPSRQDVEAAKAKLNDLNRRLGALVEQYDQEQVKLQAIQSHLAETRARAASSKAAAESAIAQLNTRAVRAYQGIGSELNILLEAQSFSEFSDRLEFMGSLAQADTDLAAKANTARQQADWAAAQLATALNQQRQLVNSLQAQEAQIRGGIAQAKQLFANLNRQYHDALSATLSASSYGISPPPGGPPPAPNPNAQAAVDAAYSVIGVPYVFAAADPSVGFDCSGLTMWAWAHAGVSLPHSAAMQYDMLPHIATSDLQPGDLVFYYSPISHVGLYIGGGRMVDAPFTGTVVQIEPVEWSVYVGAARP